MSLTIIYFYHPEHNIIYTVYILYIYIYIYIYIYGSISCVALVEPGGPLRRMLDTKKNDVLTTLYCWFFKKGWWQQIFRVFQDRYSTGRVSSEECESEAKKWCFWSWTHTYSYLRCIDVLLNVHSYTLLVYKPLVIRSNIVLIFIATNHTVTGKHFSHTLVGALRIA